MSTQELAANEIIHRYCHGCGCTFQAEAWTVGTTDDDLCGVCLDEESRARRARLQGREEVTS